MNASRFRFLWVVVCLAACVPATWAEPSEQAAQAFAQGNALLAKSDFGAALRAFSQAAQADPDNDAYRDRYMTLRQVIHMRQALADEQDPQKWAPTADALRAFYYDCRLSTEALALDQQVHGRLKTTDSAARLAETQLVMDMNAEAAELLAALDAKDHTPRTRALTGIALARLGRVDEAKAEAQRCLVLGGAEPVLCYDAARLRALLGDTREALRLLALCFESTPPSRLEATKVRAKECKDLRRLLASAESAEVLQTASKVSESTCSSGTSCGKCPMRAACAGEKKDSGTD